MLWIVLWYPLDHSTIHSLPNNIDWSIFKTPSSPAILQLELSFKMEYRPTRRVQLNSFGNSVLSSLTKPERQVVMVMVMEMVMDGGGDSDEWRQWWFSEKIYVVTKINLLDTRYLDNH